MISLCHLAFPIGGTNTHRWEKVGAIMYDPIKHECKVLLFSGFIGTLYGKAVLDDSPPYLHGKITSVSGSVYHGFIMTSEHGTYCVKLDTIPFSVGRSLLDVELEDKEIENTTNEQIAGEMAQVHCEGQ